MHLMESNHLINTSKDFRPVNIVRRLPKNAEGKIPSTTEATMIHLYAPKKNK